MAALSGLCEHNGPVGLRRKSPAVCGNCRGAVSQKYRVHAAVRSGLHTTLLVLPKGDNPRDPAPLSIEKYLPSDIYMLVAPSAFVPFTRKHLSGEYALNIRVMRLYRVFRTNRARLPLILTIEKIFCTQKLFVRLNFNLEK